MGYADSTNLYQGFGNNPANMTDPLGLVSYENQTKLSEWGLARKLKEEGWMIIFGKGGWVEHGWQESGPDVVAANRTMAYNPKKGQLALFDAKNKGVKKIYSLDALKGEAIGKWTPKGIEQLRELGADLPEKPFKLREEIIARLRSGNYAKVIASSGKGSKVEDIGPALEKEGVKFADARRGKIKWKGKGIFALVTAALILGSDNPSEAFAEAIDPAGLVGMDVGTLNENEDEMLAEYAAYMQLQDALQVQQVPSLLPCHTSTSPMTCPPKSSSDTQSQR